MLTIGQKNKKIMNVYHFQQRDKGLLCVMKKKTSQFVRKERKKESLMKCQGFW